VMITSLLPKQGKGKNLCEESEYMYAIMSCNNGVEWLY